WKGKMELSQAELVRQGRLIDDAFKHGNSAAAVGLLNEWTVSWVLWRLGEGPWLDYRRIRRKGANVLDALAKLHEDAELRERLTPEQRELGRFWKKLTALRNGYYHHGMRRQVLVGPRQANNDLKDLRDHWEKVLRSFPDVPLTLEGSEGGRVL